MGMCVGPYKWVQCRERSEKNPLELAFNAVWALKYGSESAEAECKLSLECVSCFASYYFNTQNAIFSVSPFQGAHTQTDLWSFKIKSPLHGKVTWEATKMKKGNPTVLGRLLLLSHVTVVQSGRVKGSKEHLEWSTNECEELYTLRKFKHHTANLLIACL